MTNGAKLWFDMSAEEKEESRRKYQIEMERRRRIIYLAVYDLFPNEDNFMKFSERVLGREGKYFDEPDFDLSEAFSIYFGEHREYYCFAINSKNLPGFINAIETKPRLFLKLDGDIEQSLSFARDFVSMKNRLIQNFPSTLTDLKSYRTAFFDLFVESSNLEHFNTYTTRLAQLDMDEKIVALAMQEHVSFSMEPAVEEIK